MASILPLFFPRFVNAPIAVSYPGRSGLERFPFYLPPCLAPPLSQKMLNINAVEFQAPGDFCFAVAAVRIGLHAHEAGGFALLPGGQTQDDVVGGRGKAAQALAGPYIIDAGGGEGFFKIGVPMLAMSPPVSCAAR